MAVGTYGAFILKYSISDVPKSSAAGFGAAEL